VLQSVSPHEFIRFSILRLASASLLALCGLFLTPISGAGAQDSVETLMWMHPDPTYLANFKVYLSFDEDDHSAAKAVDVRLPIDERGFYSWTVSIPEQGFVYVAVQTVDRQGQAGLLSPWRRLDRDPEMAQLESAGQPYMVDPSGPAK
jgi:hypothetical protein